MVSALLEDKTSELADMISTPEMDTEPNSESPFSDPDLNFWKKAASGMYGMKHTECM